MAICSPFVYWGQTDSTLTLRVDLKKAVNPLIELSDSRLNFSGEGYGARGQQQYLFHLNFFEDVDPSESFYKVVERDVEFVLKKKKPSIWSRLLKEQVKPAWLKVDFDNFDFEESENELEKAGIKQDDIMDWRRTPNLMREIMSKGKDGKPFEKHFGRAKKSDRNLRYTPEEFRKIYLFLYNLFQCVGCAYLLLILGVTHAKGEVSETKDSGTLDYNAAYNFLSTCIKVLHVLKVLEILHPILGYTTGDKVYPAIEMGLRLFMMFIVIDSNDKVSGRPVTFNLFLVWSFTDLIRYAYYMLRVFEVESFMTWIYYTTWFILYPLEFFCQAVLLIIAIPILEQESLLTIALPNVFNLSFSLSSILKIFLLFAFFPTFCMKCKRMYLKRKYRLRSGSSKFE